MTVDESTVRARVHARVLTDALAGGGSITVDTIEPLVRAEAPLLADGAVAALAERVVADATGLGALEDVLGDPDVTEVMVNAGPVWVERAGRLVRLRDDLDHDAIHRLIERVVGPLGLRIDRTSPVVDGRLPDGSRVCAVVPPVAVDGPCLSIRRFSSTAVPLTRFCSVDVASFLGAVVSERRNVLVCGATSAGKTTLLAALIATIPSTERLVTIEDAAELTLRGDNIVRLEARSPNAEGAGGVAVRTLLRASLRMRPDRIIVGEVRDEAALDMLQAMNTGHPGSLSTCHANSTTDALRRLETMALMGDVALSLAAVREQIAAAIDLVVHVERRAGGARRIADIAEVDESDTARWRTRSLASGDRVVAVPARPPRHTR